MGDDQKAKLAEQIPLSRLGAEDIANAVSFWLENQELVTGNHSCQRRHVDELPILNKAWIMPIFRAVRVLVLTDGY